MKRTWILALAGAAGLLLLCSCPNPLTRQMVQHVKDTIEPAITIASPAEGSSYAATVVVAGTVRDYSTAAGDPGAVKSMRYEVLGSALAGDITIDSDGRFTFQFATTNLGGTVVVRITATDWNGNPVSASLTLVDQGAIPSFKAVPDNGSVTLRWDPVPLADHYTIYYEKNNGSPNTIYSPKIENAVSGVKLSSLVNGNMHVFLLRAHSTSGDDNWSEPVKAIPLSPAHLAPTLTPSYRSILVEWNPLAGTEEYVVGKSATRNGPFINVSGTLRATSFRDYSVEQGQFYYYAVKPAQYNDLFSEANTACPDRFPRNQEREVGSCATQGLAIGVAVSGSYAYVADTDAGLRVIDISNPASPTEVASCDTPGSAWGVAVSGSYAYVADTDSGLRIIDISNPASPTEVGSCDTAGYVWDVAVSGSYAYVADDTYGLRVIDISNPALPTEAGSCDTPGLC